MTIPESIVVSLDWAKKLKEAGWPQEECLHFWVERSMQTAVEAACCAYGEWKSKTAAPTAEEILRRLPRSLDDSFDLICCASPHDGRWVVSYVDGDGWPLENLANSNLSQVTLSNAAAAMYCYLAEHKLLP